LAKLEKLVVGVGMVLRGSSGWKAEIAHVTKRQTVCRRRGKMRHLKGDPGSGWYFQGPLPFSREVPGTKKPSWGGRDNNI
jgi:hypothetical protein